MIESFNPSFKSWNFVFSYLLSATLTKFMSFLTSDMILLISFFNIKVSFKLKLFLIF